MKYPCVVPQRLCKTEIRLEISREGVNEFGEPQEPISFDGRCNFQDKARTVMTAEKKLVEITGVVLIPGDICQELPVISGGKANVYGCERVIQQGRKARNPDGTVNYTEVLLI